LHSIGCTLLAINQDFFACSTFFVCDKMDSKNSRNDEDTQRGADSDNESLEGSFNRIPSFVSTDSNLELELMLEQEKSESNSRKAKSDEPKHLVRYKDEVFNIFSYLDDHPGGRSILEKYENMDITRAFDDINHSQFARKKMRSFLVTDKSVTITPVTIKGNKVDFQFVYKKLFSKEDKNFVHKTFGFLSLLSYCYRYLYVFPMTGSLGFNGSNFDWVTLFLHFMLSSSSLIFHVVEKRILSNPLIIYQEYRLHAIIFTLRATLISIFGLYYHHLPTVQARVCLSLILVMLHSTVDYITHKHGTPGITTVRNGNDQQIRNIKLFFAFYQVLALASHVTVDENLKDLGFNTLIAIQSSGMEN
jgi:cytochrome b involved in lipid metabolism